MSIRFLKWAAIVSFFFAIGTLLIGGFFAKDKVPPIPGRVVDARGNLLFEKSDIMAGQHVYQRYGLMDHGSVWGHGSQRGPEFSAMTLNMLGMSMRDRISLQEYGRPFTSLDRTEQGIVELMVRNDIKSNRYDADRDELTLSGHQTAALDGIYEHWEKTFRDGDIRYGFLPNTVQSAEERRQISRFFLWTAWAAGTLRPGDEYTYTSNWPPDRLVGNVPSTATYLWTLGGIISLFLVLGLFIWAVHHYGIWYGEAKGVSLSQKLIEMPLTPSQYKAAKYFLVVILLFLLQTCFGGLLAHYTVNPAHFYLSWFADIIPYSWAKSWHLQLAIFWIATTWVASAIYLAPIVGGREPKKQGLLVNILFAAILIVAVGSLAGQIAGIKGKLGDWWFWLGHQGWEYLELGRLWQILLFIGLIAWLFIVYRAIAGHFRARRQGVEGNEHFSSLIVFYAISAILVVGFFGFGLLYGPDTHISIADYWRWFVVHIWVESIFEFFGVAVISVVIVSMGLATARDALVVAYFTAALVFLSGILGVSHHYFWYGGPSFWLAVGSVFSSLEPVPLFGLIVRGLLEYRDIRKQGQEFPYKWPLYFLVASSFWNFLGAGLFGFLINLPIVNYYEHGTYLTMNHGHAALFGVYGMLSIGLLLFAWRGMVQKEFWNDKLLNVSFWGFNVGLLLMTLGTLFPVGVIQAWVSFREGMWAARSADFFERGVVQFLGEVRLIPDSIIILLGVVPLAWFLFRTYPKLKAVRIGEGESVWERMGIKEIK